MKYINSVCDGCGLPLREDDDIVVCPECGTPQHRECYKKENRCVNVHRHSEGFEWGGGSVSAPVETRTVKETKQDMLPCPSCGHMNPRDAKRCESCSMKLIVFGMNLAEGPEGQNPYRRDSDELPDYDPPFTIGQGEGFENTEEKKEPEFMPPSAEEYTSAGQTPYTPEGFVPPQQPPFAEEERKRETARQHLLFRFIGSNISRYMDAFRKIDNGRGFTFNWAAFITSFLGPYWFFYRKLYKPGIILTTVSMVVSIIFTPVLVQFVTISEAYSGYGEALYTDEALITAFMQELAPVYPVVIAFFVARFAISLISGLIAFPLYKKYAESSVEKVMSSPSAEFGLSLARKLGGTSVLAAIGSYLAIEIISSVVAMIM
ncbi:MAG: DUF2628 domain-containing protein [Clostridia bacterium]|nr:DUF2628 domain-containing protein [Clostridia bacterium]